MGFGVNVTKVEAFTGLGVWSRSRVGMICISPGPRDRACGQLTVVTATRERTYTGQQAASVVWPGERREDQERPVLT